MSTLITTLSTIQTNVIRYVGSTLFSLWNIRKYLEFDFYSRKENFDQIRVAFVSDRREKLFRFFFSFRFVFNRFFFIRPSFR